MSITKKDKMTYCKTIYNQDLVRQGECDITLPEYCPDMLKILRADANMWIESAAVSQENAAINGKILIKVLYVAEDGENIVAIDHTLPFEEVIPIDNARDDCLLISDIQKKYINCRMQSPRKISAKCAYILSARAEQNEDVDIITGGDNLEMLTVPITYCTLVGADDNTIKIEEDITIGELENPIANLLSCSGTVKVVEQKTINNKVIAKGLLSVDSVYANADGGINTNKTEIPFNHIYEIDGIDEESVCLCNMHLKNLVNEVYENSAGENKIIAIEADIRCVGHAYANKAVDVCADAFSTNYQTNLAYETISTWGQPQVLNGNANINQTVDFEENIMRVYAVSGEPVIAVVTPYDDGIAIKGTLAVSVLCMTEQNGTQNIDVDLPFECVIANDMTELEYVFAHSILDNLSFNINASNSIDVKAAVPISCLVKRRNECDTVLDVEIDESKPVKAKNDYVIVYYPTENETFWNIAKRYNVSCQEIKRLNNCSGDECNLNILLIPRS